jgi:hypothetical protein
MKLKRNLCLGPRRRLQGARSVVRISGHPVDAVASRFRQSIVCSPSTSFVRKLSRVGFAPRTASFIVASEGSGSANGCGPARRCRTLGQLGAQQVAGADAGEKCAFTQRQ